MCWWSCREGWIPRVRDSAGDYGRCGFGGFEIEAALVSLVFVGDERLGGGRTCLAVDLDHPVAVRHGQFLSNDGGGAALLDIEDGGDRSTAQLGVARRDGEIAT